MNLILYSPTCEPGINEIKKRVATVHAQTALEQLKARHLTDAQIATFFKVITQMQHDKGET